jgi:hypothetical protein
MEESHNVPPKLFRRSGGKGGIEVAGHGKQRAHDVIRLKLVGFDQGSQQLIGCIQDLAGIVVVDRRSTANALEANWEGHGA